MIVKVKSARTGEEYSVDTTNVTCTCKGFIYNKKRFMIGDPERMCKHIRQVFEEKPETFPKVCIDAEKAVEEASKETGDTTTFSDSGIVRSEFTPLVGMLKDLLDIPGNKLVTSGDYRVGKPTISRVTMICGIDPSNYGKHLMSDLSNSKMKMLGITTDYDGNANQYRFTFIPAGMKVIDVKLVKLNDLVFERLFDTGPKESILELINRANNNGLKLSKSGFEGLDNSMFPDESSIYEKLGLTIPYERIKYYED